MNEFLSMKSRGNKMKHTIVTVVLSVSLTLLLCSGLLNYYQYSQRSVYSCMDGYDQESRDQMQDIVNQNAGMNLPKGSRK